MKRYLIDLDAQTTHDLLALLTKCADANFFIQDLERARRALNAVVEGMQPVTVDASIPYVQTVQYLEMPAYMIDDEERAEQ